MRHLIEQRYARDQRQCLPPCSAGAKIVSQIDAQRHKQEEVEEGLKEGTLLQKIGVSGGIRPLCPRLPLDVLDELKGFQRIGLCNRNICTIVPGVGHRQHRQKQRRHEIENEGEHDDRRREREIPEPAIDIDQPWNEDQDRNDDEQAQSDVNGFQIVKQGD